MAGLAASIKGQSVLELDPKGKLGVLLTFYWGGAMIGRFIGAGLMQRVKPALLLGVFATVALILVVASSAATGLAALLMLLGVGLFNSIMFPTIFSLGIAGLGQYTSQGSGILCLAIVGGAVVPLLQGYLADSFGIQPAFLLAVVCYLYIAFYGLKGSTPATR